MAANLDQALEEYLRLAANPGRALAATLDRAVEAVVRLGQSDALLLAAGSGSEARFPEAIRLEGRSLRYRAATLGQVGQGLAAVDAPDDRERRVTRDQDGRDLAANLDQDDRVGRANLDQDGREILANLDQDALGLEEADAPDDREPVDRNRDLPDGRGGMGGFLANYCQDERRDRRSNTRFQCELMPYGFYCIDGVEVARLASGGRGAEEAGIALGLREGTSGSSRDGTGGTKALPEGVISAFGVSTGSPLVLVAAGVPASNGVREAAAAAVGTV